MNLLIVFLRKNWMIILILLNIPVAIWFWIWVSHLVRDDGNAAYFNNIISPIATIVSAALFLIAILQTSRQAKFIERQHELDESNHAKGHLNQEFEIVQSQLEQDFGNYIRVGIGIPNGQELEEKYRNLEINCLNFIPFLREELTVLVSNADFIQDHMDFLNKEHHTSYHYRNRAYNRTLQSINQICLYVDYKYKLIGEILELIKVSKLTREEQIFFRRKIEATWLKDYLEFLNFESSITFPDVRQSNSNGKVNWIQLNETPLADFLRKFKEYFG